MGHPPHNPKTPNSRANRVELAEAQREGSKGKNRKKNEFELINPNGTQLKLKRNAAESEWRAAAPGQARGGTDPNRPKQKMTVGVWSGVCYGLLGVGEGPLGFVTGLSGSVSAEKKPPDPDRPLRDTKQTLTAGVWSGVCLGLLGTVRGLLGFVRDLWTLTDP